MNDIFEKVKSLNIPNDKYTVVGSGSMSAHGIRVHNDIDILVTQDIFDRFKAKGWDMLSPNQNFKVLVKDDFEMSATMCTFGDYSPDTQALIKNSVQIGGVTFSNLNDVVDFKKALGREKDLSDIKLIEKYLEDNK